MGRVEGKEFIFCRSYACPLALSEEAFLAGKVANESAFDTRGFPLTMRPLVGSHTGGPRRLALLVVITLPYHLSLCSSRSV